MQDSGHLLLRQRSQTVFMGLGPKNDKALGREISAFDVRPVISGQWDMPGFKFPLRK